MIKFFRKIRQKLLMENKTGKYFKYAIGEIVLVVIGILIALQINTWNNNRLAKKQMESYLVSLKEDLKQDTTNLASSISAYKYFIKTKAPLKRLSFENTPTDSLFLLILTRTAKKNTILSTYNKIGNSKITQISENNTLSNKIYDYYNSSIIYFNEMIDYDRMTSIKITDYWVYEQNIYEMSLNPEIPNSQGEEQSRKALLKLISGPKGKNHLKVGYDNNIRMLEVYQNRKSEATNLIIDIEKEIKKSK